MREKNKEKMYYDTEVVFESDDHNVKSIANQVHDFLVRKNKKSYLQQRHCIKFKSHS